ncbi:MAG: xylulokinase, partial [Candidatus Bathyarchaeia archaeon]
MGTTETKAILVDECGNLVSEKSRELPLIYSEEGYIEQDIEEIWAETAAVIKRCLRGEHKSRLACIAVTGQRETLCPLDREFASLRNAISWQDTRGWRVCKKMSQELGSEEVYRITGLPINTMPWASKLVWIQENEKPTYEKTWKFVGVVDYTVWKLCGDLKMDYSNACRTMLFDLSKLKWSERMFEYLGLDLDKMPELVPPGQILGSVTKEASEDTNLPVGITVVYGGGDQQCNALGVGVTDSKKISCVLGTCTNIEGYSERPPLDPEMRLQAQLHVVPNS